jgi:protein involved in polysaccharide export with SLBB domain
VPLEPDDVVLVPNITERRAMVLGQVKEPTVVTLRPGVTLVEAVSRAGGLAESADLRGALLLRDRRAVPVDFEKLFRRGDLSQDVPLEPDDVILVPDLKEKRVLVLGQVEKPQVFALTPDLTLLESVSRAGGLTKDADLKGALLIRDGQAQPVSFERLLSRGDLRENVLLRPDDVVLIPNIQDKRVFVLGEVSKPATVTLKPGVTLVEAITQAGGFTKDAKRSGVVVMRGGPGDPRMLTVEMDRLTESPPDTDFSLEPGDIIYVPRTLMADVLRVFQNITTLLTPVIQVMSGIVLGAAAKSVFSGEENEQPGISVGTPP